MSISCYSQTSDFTIHEHGIVTLDTARAILNEFDKVTELVTGDEMTPPLIGFENRTKHSFLEITRRANLAYHVRFQYVQVWFLRFTRLAERYGSCDTLLGPLECLELFFTGRLDEESFSRIFNY